MILGEYLGAVAVGLVVGCAVGWWLRTLKGEVPDRRVEEELRRGLLSSDLDHALCEPVRRPVRFRRCGPLPYIHPGEIRDMRIDTWMGMIFSQSAAWFIIVTTAGTLHTAGVEDINSAAQAAEALEPLVHSFPYAG